MYISQGKGDVLKMMYALKREHCLSIIGDLNAFQSNIFVPFFGKMASKFWRRCFCLTLKKNIPLIFWIEETKVK